MIELALVLPILLFLALGIVDFGRAMNYWNDVNQIAADGARYAAVSNNPGSTVAPPTGPLTFREWLRAQAVTGELKDRVLAGGTAAFCAANPQNTEVCSQSVGKRLKVCVEPAVTGQTLTAGQAIRVRVESTYNLIPFIGEQTEFGTVAIKGDAVMRLEQDYSATKMGVPGCSP